ncbi:hypothetical protein MEC_01103 [Bartonella alsatica IBS 382]|uniref:Transmembrane protein n=1 Tax=Bartonella alsatica IBS 382 TaxID=1094551 RepID=J0PWM0_9HYPH|nr:hypothetical protein MEC_01103 [Bartonella alsatica IBS 382]
MVSCDLKKPLCKGIIVSKEQETKNIELLLFSPINLIMLLDILYLVASVNLFLFVNQYSLNIFYNIDI